MLDISLQGVKKTYYQKTILESVSIEIYAGSKIAVIGRNGAGKTTLFKLIMRDESPDLGQITVRKGLRMGLLHQMPEHRPNQQVIEVLQEGFQVLNEKKTALEKMEIDIAKESVSEQLLKRYGELLTAFELEGGYEMDYKLKEITQAMKLENFLFQDFENLSGGEKTRVLFARLLLQSPDVLLLDEPTNHLDSDMLNWLENYLNSYLGTVIIISHDRYFLDQVAQQIVELEHGRSDVYDGNYSVYALEKQKKVELMAQAYQLQQKKIKAIEAAIKRFELWGSIGDNEKFFKKANQFKAKLEKMDKVINPHSGHLNYDLELENTRKSSQILVDAMTLSLGYDHKALMEQVHVTIRKGQKICLLGANGSGKSTFLKAILGEVQPMSGEIKLSPSASMSYIPQDIVFEDDSLSLLDWCIQTLKTTSGEGRNLLAHYGFRDQEVFRGLKTLSGGERSRLKLIQLSKTKHTLLLLDEPTNHMDIPSREQLETLLSEFDGTLLVISHDRYFIEMIATDVLWLHQKKMDYVEGGYTAFLAMKEQEALKPKNQKNKDTKPAEPLPKDRPKTYQKEKLRLQVVEADIHVLETELETLAKAIEASASDYQRLEQLTKEAQGLKNSLDSLYSEWAELTEAIG
jgi:ATPase subunit of ABC transporter with duplicated ATPase domains